MTRTHSASKPVNSVVNTKLPCYTVPLTQHHSFLRNVLSLLIQRRSNPSLSQGNLVFYTGNVPGDIAYTADHFQGSASHDEKTEIRIRTFPCVNSFDSSACPQTQTIDGRRQTEGGRRYMTGPDPEIQSCHAIT